MSSFKHIRKNKYGSVFDEIATKVAKETGSSRQEVLYHVQNLFAHIGESMNSFEHEGYYLRGFCSFQRMDYRYNKALKDLSMFRYLKTKNKHKTNSEFDWLESNEDFKSYKQMLLSQYGDLQTIKNELTKLKNNGKVK